MDINNPAQSLSQPPEQEQAPSRIYIEIQYHPHSHLPNTIISLDSSSVSKTSLHTASSPTRTSRKPWAPFPSLADFEWAETMYMASRDAQDRQLEGMHSGKWCQGSKLMIKKSADLQRYLEKARHYVVEACLSLFFWVVILHTVVSEV